MIEKLIQPVSDIVGKFVKDNVLLSYLDHELATLFHQANLAQIEILKEDAKSSNWFQNSWRPFVGWTCGVAMAYHFIVQPLLHTTLTAFGVEVQLPDFDFAQLSTILMAMLGMSSLRSYEKKHGVHGK